MASSDLTGKTVVITGASAGLGAIAAREMASRGATVVPIGRNPQKTATVAKSIGVEGVVADFASLKRVRTLADELLDRCPQIDVLANNAGGLFSGYEVTEDGHELTFQANHLAPFLLTNLLRERLQADGGGRVISTASIAHKVGKVNFDDLDNLKRRYRAFPVYGTSKLENILFTRELAQRWNGTGVTAVCFHPGAVASEFGRDSFATGLIYRTPLKKLFTITPEQGAAPLVELAARDDIESVNGAYFSRHKPAGTSGQSNDPEVARELWDRSAAMVGLA